MRIPLVYDTNLYALRTRKLAEHKESVTRDQAWLDSHPNHKLRDTVQDSLAEHEVNVKRLEATLRRCEVVTEWVVSPYEDKESFRCMVCGEAVFKSGGAALGRYVHLGCVGAFKRGEKC